MEALEKKVESRINRYLARGELKGHRVSYPLLSRVCVEARNSGYGPTREEGLAVMRYFISESFEYHSEITEEDWDTGRKVIYGDYFGTLFHRAVIDYGEYEECEKLISIYKKKCISEFDRGESAVLIPGV